MEDGKLVLTAKSAAENTFDFDLRKDGQPLTGKVYIEYKVEIMDNTKEARLEPRNSGSTLYSMAFELNSGKMTPWVATGQSAPTPQGNPLTEWGPWLSTLVSDSYVIKSTINTETQEIEELTCNGTDIIPNGAKYFRQYANGLDRIRLYRASGGEVDTGICSLEYIKVWQDEISIEDAQADLDAITENVILNGQSADSVTGDLNLIKTGSVNGTPITWTASPEGIINTDTGAVTRPTEDTQVTLTSEAAGLSKQFNITVKAQEPEQIKYLLNHDYSGSDYDTIEEVFGTGKYWIAGVGSGNSAEYSNNNIEFKVENGELIAHVKNTGGISHLEVDLRDDNGNPQTGKIWIEYKINLKNLKKTMVEPRSGNAVVTTTYYQGTNWSSVSMATGTSAPTAEANPGTDWGRELSDGSNSYTMMMLYNTDTKTIDEFYCNGKDVSSQIGDYFRHNAQGIDRLRFYDNAGSQFTAEADVYGLEYIKAWKVMDDFVFAKEDLDAITYESISGMPKDSLVTSNLTLPSVGTKHESNTTWSSSDPDIISDEGVVNRDGLTEDTKVIMTATADHNGVSRTATFEITVAGYIQNIIITNFSCEDGVLSGTVQARTAQTPLSFVMVAAVYDSEGRLISCEVSDTKNVDADVLSETIENTFETEVAPDAAEAKLLIFDSMSSIKSLCSHESITF